MLSDLLTTEGVRLYCVFAYSLDEEKVQRLDGRTKSGNSWTRRPFYLWPAARNAWSRRAVIPDQNSSVDLDEPIWGAEAIANEIKRNKRATFHMLEKGLLPAERVGGRWVSTRRRLRAFFSGESKAA